MRCNLFNKVGDGKLGVGEINKLFKGETVYCSTIWANKRETAKTRRINGGTAPAIFESVFAFATALISFSAQRLSRAAVGVVRYCSDWIFLVNYSGVSTKRTAFNNQVISFHYV